MENTLGELYLVYYKGMYPTSSKSLLGVYTKRNVMITDINRWCYNNEYSYQIENDFYNNQYLWLTDISEGGELNEDMAIVIEHIYQDTLLNWLC